MGNSKSVNGGFSIFDSPPEGEHDGASSEARCFSCCCWPIQFHLGSLHSGIEVDM